MDTQGDHAKVVREWFYPEWGELKFVYSEKEARDIRQHFSEGVLWKRIQVSTMEPGKTGRSSAEHVARNEGADLPGTAGG